LKKILIFGYGNPGRQDDALGVLLADLMEKWAEEMDIKSMDFDTNYQLNIEDALTISEYDMVVFADASIEKIADFKLSKVKPSQKTEFTMHAMSPDFVLHLCQSLYNKYPATYLLHIKGVEFEMKESLTVQGKNNLALAYEFLVNAFTKFSYPKDLLDRHCTEQTGEIKF
jgi:hydrogenase maturation protease